MDAVRTLARNTRHDLYFERRKQHTILLVEDDESNRETIQLLLQTETPYRVLSFENEEQTLDHLQEIKYMHPVLLVLDYFLPTMTACDLYAQLHAVEDLAAVPALIITAGLPRETETKLTAQHLPLLYKPFSIAEFLDAVMTTIAS